MPADVTNAKRMLLSSDYPIDKIVGLYSGSFDVPNPSSGYIHTIAHGLPFRPLPGGNWSNSSDFSLQYEYGTGVYPGPPGQIYSQRTNVYADATNIYINVTNISGSDKTIYYRVFVFEPSDSEAEVDGIAGQGDNFLSNSDYNYPKLYLNGYEDIPANPGGSINVDVEHNIGTIPQTMGWVAYDSWNGSEVVDAVHPIGSSSTYVLGVLMSANDSHVNFTVPTSAGGRRAYYRIYLDE